MCRSFIAILPLLWLGSSLTGCATFWKSRYAMDDPTYAAKYAEGVPKRDVLGKLKQAIDARHTAGLEGMYFGGGTQWRNDYESTLAGIEIGTEAYPDSWFSQRVGFSGFLGHDDWYAGIDSGARIQLPTRLAPFAGLGMFHGLSTTREDATRDGEDNDDDGLVDEYGETAVVPDGWLSTVYPELGIHFWPAGQARLTVYARYLVSSEGRNYDDWLAGFQFTAFERK